MCSGEESWVEVLREGEDVEDGGVDGLVDRLSQEWGWAGGGCALYRGQLTIKSPLPCCIISLLLLDLFQRCRC